MLFAHLRGMIKIPNVHSCENKTAPVFIGCKPQATFPPGTLVVHFIRDPYSMAISSYLYHRRNPTPENWVNKLYGRDAICNAKKWLTSTSSSLRLESESVTELCNAFVTSAPGSSYYEKLTNLNDIKALMLELTRLMISPSGGDLLYMPYNIRWFQHSNLDVHSILMDRWKANSDNEFRRLLRFISKSVAGHGNKKMLLSIENRNLRPALQHTTKIDHETQHSWEDALNSHHVLGPMLRTIHRFTNLSQTVE